MVFETLTVQEEGAVLHAEIAAPPMNLLGPELVRDLVSLIQQAEADDAAQVLVFKSADPDYFISHVDVTRIDEYRAEAAKLTGEASIALLFHHLSASRLVTIARIEGRVRGAGSEFVLACDMRFAAWPNGTAGSIERCPPTSWAISSDRSLTGSLGFPPPAMSPSRSGSTRSRSHQPMTSVATPTSSARACATPRPRAGSAPR
jgi:Enoyl-CoA hydratase/isomerase